VLHVYASHLGGYFTTTKKLTFEEESCEQCGGCDWFLGTAKTEKDAEKMYNTYIDDNF